MTFEVGQQVIWQFPRRAEPLPAEILRKDDARGWWVVKAHGLEFFASERELSPAQETFPDHICRHGHPDRTCRECFPLNRRV